MPTESRREAAERITDDLPYRIVEEMGLGLTFRSCTCGQLPCARLQPLRDALEAVRRDEFERVCRLLCPFCGDKDYNLVFHHDEWRHYRQKDMYVELCQAAAISNEDTK